MSSSLTRREATLYTLLRATLNRSGEAVENIPLTGVEFFQSSIRDRAPRKGYNGKLIAYSGHFMDHTTVRCPFHVVFSGPQQCSGIHNRMAMTGGVNIEQQLRALMAITNYLVTRGELPKISFDETVKRTATSRVGSAWNLDEVAAGFHSWAANLIKRSALEYDEQQQSLVELLSYEHAARVAA